MNGLPHQIVDDASREYERHENIELIYQLFQEAIREEAATVSDEERLFWLAIMSAFGIAVMKLKAKDHSIAKEINNNPRSSDDNKCHLCKKPINDHILSIDEFGTVVAGIYTVGNIFQVCLHNKMMNSYSKLLERTWKLITLRDREIERLRQECDRWKLEAEQLRNVSCTVSNNIKK